MHAFYLDGIGLIHSTKDHDDWIYELYACIFPHSTKQVSRFHPPYVLEAIKLLAQHTDQLKINAQSAWDDFLTYVMIVIDNLEP